jgi:hypothetical protein
VFTGDFHHLVRRPVRDAVSKIPHFARQSFASPMNRTMRTNEKRRAEDPALCVF